MDIYKTQYDILKYRAYDAYTKEWCRLRGYDIAKRNRENGFNGEDYVCVSEFEMHEFKDAEYIKTLFSEENFEIYLKVMKTLENRNH